MIWLNWWIWLATLEFWSKLATAFLCSAIRVFNDLCVIDFVHYAWFLAVRIVSLFGTRKKAVGGLLWFVSYLDLLSFPNATYFLGNFLYIRQHYKAIEVVLVLQTINSLFSRAKERDDFECQKSGIVYKMNCTQWHFVYYGQTERSLKTRIADHKKAVASFDHNSKVSSHVHQLVWNSITTSDFSLKPGTLLWTRTRGTITWITWSRAQVSRYVTSNSVW